MSSNPTLERYKGRSSRHTCPRCQKPFQFTRYVYPDTGKPIHPTVGKCNRVNKCGYHYPPREYFMQYRSHESEAFRYAKNPAAGTGANAIAAPSTIPLDVFQQSQARYEDNNFVRWLQMLFADDAAMELVRLYKIGTSKHWPGATVFWQIDSMGQVRAGKIMHYDPATGRRTKEPETRITWAHSVLRIDGFNLRQCLFGEHLLAQFPSKPVAIVESEKTAVICCLFMPGFVWLATGGKGNLTAGLLQPILGREVVLFPDLGAFKEWKSKAAQLKWAKKMVVSESLQLAVHHDSQCEGFDLADLLVNPDPETGLALTLSGYPAFWDFHLPVLKATSLKRQLR